MPKKTVFLLLLLSAAAAFSCVASGKSRTDVKEPALNLNTVSLEKAIGEFSTYIGERLPKATLTAITITETPIQKLGNYIIDELAVSLLNNTSLRIVSRQDFERILSEQSLQSSLTFDDNTTAKIGHGLGWQTIIMGTIEPMHEAYRLSLRAVDVETGELRGSRNYLLNGKDPILICCVNPDITTKQLAEREAILQPFDGKNNNFQLTVATNKSVYYDNDTMFITLRANENCYFIVCHVDVYDNMQVIYPNMWDRGKNYLTANVTRVIPEDSTYLLQAPYGEERILVYASEKPISISSDQYVPRSISSDYISSLETTWHIENNSDDVSAEDENNDGEPAALPAAMSAAMPEGVIAEPAELAENSDTDSAPLIAEGSEIAVAGARDITPDRGQNAASGDNGRRGVSVVPRKATAQISYTILPGK